MFGKVVVTRRVGFVAGEEGEVFGCEEELFLGELFVDFCVGWQAVFAGYADSVAGESVGVVGWFAATDAEFDDVGEVAGSVVG